MFLLTLSCVLHSEGLPNGIVEKILAEYENVQFGKSADRSVLGSANDLAFHYKHLIMDAGGVHSCKVPEIIRQLNRMPMLAGSRNSKFPIDELRKLYAVQSNNALH